MPLNYYEVLGVDRSASEAEIRDAFRRLAREKHPDRFRGAGKADAEKSFQLLTEAVNVLTNPAKRRQHDSELSTGTKSGSDPAQVARAYLAMGVKAFKEGDFLTAREQFEMASRHSPDDTKALHYLALASARSPSTLRQAVQAIETAVQKEPMNPVFLRDAGMICKHAGLNSKAERYLEEAAKWDRDNPDIRAALEELRGAKAGTREAAGRGLLDSIFRKG